MIIFSKNKSRVALITSGTVTVLEKYKMSISISLEKAVYCPGEAINGKLFVETPKKIKTKGVRLLFKGVEHTRWTESESETDADGTTSYFDIWLPHSSSALPTVNLTLFISGVTFFLSNKCAHVAVDGHKLSLSLCLSSLLYWFSA